MLSHSQSPDRPWVLGFHSISVTPPAFVSWFKFLSSLSQLSFWGLPLPSASKICGVTVVSAVLKWFFPPLSGM